MKSVVFLCSSHWPRKRPGNGQPGGKRRLFRRVQLPERPGLRHDRRLQGPVLGTEWDALRAKVGTIYSRARLLAHINIRVNNQGHFLNGSQITNGKRTAVVFSHYAKHLPTFVCSIQQRRRKGHRPAVIREWPSNYGAGQGRSDRQLQCCGHGRGPRSVGGRHSRMCSHGPNFRFRSFQRLDRHKSEFGRPRRKSTKSEANNYLFLFSPPHLQILPSKAA